MAFKWVLCGYFCRKFLSFGKKVILVDRLVEFFIIAGLLIKDFIVRLPNSRVFYTEGVEMYLTGLENRA